MAMTISDFGLFFDLKTNYYNSSEGQLFYTSSDLFSCIIEKPYHSILPPYDLHFDIRLIFTNVQDTTYTYELQKSEITYDEFSTKQYCRVYGKLNISNIVNNTAIKKVEMQVKQGGEAWITKDDTKSHSIGQNSGGLTVLPSLVTRNSRGEISIKYYDNTNITINTFAKKQEYYNTSPSLSIKGVAPNGQLLNSYYDTIQLSWVPNFQVEKSYNYNYKYIIKITDNTSKSFYYEHTGIGTNQETITTTITDVLLENSTSHIKCTVTMFPQISSNPSVYSSYGIESLETTINKRKTIEELINTIIINNFLLHPRYTEYNSDPILKTKIDDVKNKITLSSGISLVTGYDTLSFPKCEIKGKDEEGKEQTSSLNIVERKDTNNWYSSLTLSLSNAEKIPYTPEQLSLKIVNVFGEELTKVINLDASNIQYSEPLFFHSDAITLSAIDNNGKVIYTPSLARRLIINPQERLRIDINPSSIYIPELQKWGDKSDLETLLMDIDYEFNNKILDNPIFYIESQKGCKVKTGCILEYSTLVDRFNQTQKNSTVFGYIGVNFYYGDSELTKSSSLNSRQNPLLTIQIGRINPSGMTVDFCKIDGFSLIYRLSDNGGDKNEYYDYNFLTNNGLYESSLSRTQEEFLEILMFDTQTPTEGQEPVLSFAVQVIPEQITIQQLRRCLLENINIELPLLPFIQQSLSESEEEYLQNVTQLLSSVQSVKCNYYYNKTSCVSFDYKDIVYVFTRPTIGRRPNGLIINGEPNGQLNSNEFMQINILEAAKGINFFYINEETGQKQSVGRISLQIDDSNNPKLFLENFYISKNQIID